MHQQGQCSLHLKDAQSLHQKEFLRLAGRHLQDRNTLFKVPVKTAVDDPLDESNHCVAKYATSGAWYDAPTTWAREVA